MTEFGNLALIDQDAGEENGVAVPLPGVRKGEQKSPACPSPTALVALLLPLWGCNMGSACFYIGTSFWNLECLGWPRGRGPCVFAPQAGPVTASQKARAPFCSLSLDQSDPPRLGRNPWARRAVCRLADALRSSCSQTCALMPSSTRPQHLTTEVSGVWEGCFPPTELFFVGPRGHPWAAQWT